MRSFILLCGLIASISSHAFNNWEGRILPMEYVVISNEADASIEKGTFVLEGNVKMFSSEAPLSNVLIGCLSSGTWTRSGEEGEFSITLNSKDEVVYFYKEGWTEVVIEDYKFKEGHRIVVDVWLAKVQQSDKPDVMRKPVIYMYSDTDLDAKVYVKPRGEFTFTYPEYKDKWSVTVKKEGGITCDGVQYPYLFWEAESSNMSYFVRDNQIPGFMVESADITNFFEDKLTSIGLNETERTDFITYWAPQLLSKEYVFVQFHMDEKYDVYVAAGMISPTPDSWKRVFMYCCPLDSPDIGYEVVPQEFPTFERKGFTVVEWGGSILNLPNHDL